MSIPRSFGIPFLVVVICWLALCAFGFILIGELAIFYWRSLNEPLAGWFRGYLITSDQHVSIIAVTAISLANAMFNGVCVGGGVWLSVYFYSAKRKAH